MPAYLRSALVVASLFLLAACGDSGSVDTPTVAPTPLPPTAAPSPSPIPPEATAEPAEAEKVLTLLYWQAPSLPGPYLSAGTKDSDAGAITLEPLARYDPEGNLVPALAAEIPTTDNGGFAQDQMSITWKLRRA